MTTSVIAPQVMARAGQTAPIDLQLTGTDPTTGVTQNVDLTGVTVIELHMEDDSGTVVTFSLANGKLSILDAPTGKLRVSPGATDLVYKPRPYDAWIKVTDATGKIVPFPTGVNFSIYVAEAF